VETPHNEEEEEEDDERSKMVRQRRNKAKEARAKNRSEDERIFYFWGEGLEETQRKR